MTRLGIITIGQAPRTDLVPAMLEHLPNIEVIERGALDGLSAAEIARFVPAPGDEILTSRLAGGDSATFGRQWILDPLQAHIHALEATGVDANLLVCTGDFPEFDHRRPLLRAGQLVAGGIDALAQGQLGVISPLPEQRELTLRKFARLDPPVLVAAADPYQGSSEDFIQAAKTLVADGATMIFLDCMGYDDAQRRLIREVSGVPVILARTLVARLAAEVVS